MSELIDNIHKHNDISVSKILAMSSDLEDLKYFREGADEANDAMNAKHIEIMKSCRDLESDLLKW